MHLLLKNILFSVFILALSASLVYWIESEKEVEILCSMFDTGQSRTEVERTLNTANLLKLTSTQDSILASSPYNLHSMNCTIAFNELNLVTRAEFTRHFDLSGTLTVIGLILSIGLLLLQMLLALGYPLGRYAWGGEHVTLPRNLRVGSAFSALIFLFIIVLLWRKMVSGGFFDIAYPVLGVLFLLSSYANFNSKSLPEKRTGTPAAVLIYLCFLSLSLQ